MKKRSKRYKNIHKDVKSKKANSLKEVFEIIKKIQTLNSTSQ